MDETRSSDCPMNVGDPGRRLTERYISALHQLTSASPDIRLGEIYALERLAKDSPEEQPIVVGILSAFVCIRVASRSGIGHGLRDRPWCARTGWGWVVRAFGRVGRDADLQAALTVLGRLPRLAESVR
ncbi:hypothetical protein FDG2_4138 [Candidatus Protofrankia californiensis]|uniref:Uncharacterized protein n=1 Tax=Candidatus Protofrankia californiensis TaxID=1839754 RepID=A0A1C3P3R0_9ACTN|nr:hypothetical protein FDG2_4138 [Candidatus Protofrankia californiensis]